MADNTEDRGYSPVGHCFGHHVGYRDLVWCICLQADVNAVFADFQRVHRLPGIFVSTGRSPGLRVEIPAMPGAPQQALAVLSLLYCSFTQRTALMRAAVFHCVVFTVNVRQRHGVNACGHCLDATFWQFINISNAVPFEHLILHQESSSMSCSPADSTSRHRSTR